MGSASTPVPARPHEHGQDTLYTITGTGTQADTREVPGVVLIDPTTGLPYAASGGGGGGGAVTQSGAWSVGVTGGGNALSVSVAGAAKVDGTGGTFPVTGTFWQATQPVSGTFWQATQPVSAAALPLPSGASISAKQPALGTAGAPSTDVITVQGAASMTPFKISGDVASGATDSGNPVKAGGVYRLVRTPLTDGQRGDLSITSDYELRTYGRALSSSIDSVLVGQMPGAIYKVWSQLYDGVSNTAIGSYTPNTSSSAGENVCTVNYKNLVGVASATVSASPATATLDVSRFSELILFIKTGAVVGAGTLTFVIQTLGPDGTYYPIWTSTAIGASTTIKVSLGRGLPGALPASASGVSGEYGCAVGQQVQLVITLAGTSVVCGYGLMAKM